MAANHCWNPQERSNARDGEHDGQDAKHQAPDSQPAVLWLCRNSGDGWRFVHSCYAFVPLVYCYWAVLAREFWVSAISPCCSRTQARKEQIPFSADSESKRASALADALEAN